MRFITALGSILVLFAVGVFVATPRTAMSSASDINIHNIQKTFDALNCTVTITWDTDECTTTNLVRWDGTHSCATGPTYPNTEYDNTAGRSHTVVIDLSAGPPPKVTFQVESSNACDTQTSSCMSVVSSPCIHE